MPLEITFFFALMLFLKVWLWFIGTPRKFHTQLDDDVFLGVLGVYLFIFLPSCAKRSTKSSSGRKIVFRNMIWMSMVYLKMGVCPSKRKCKLAAVWKTYGTWWKCEKAREITRLKVFFTFFYSTLRCWESNGEYGNTSKVFWLFIYHVIKIWFIIRFE